MARSVVDFNPATDTWGQLFTKHNDLANALTTFTVTTNLNSNGDFTTGNGYVFGIFGATTLVATTIKAGNVDTAGAFLNLASNTHIGGDLIVSGAFVVNALAFNYSHKTSFTFNANTVSQVVDSFPLATYRGGEYLISMKDNIANNRQITKLLVIHNGTSTDLVEYGTLTTNNSIGTFSSSANSTYVLISYASGTSSNVALKGDRTLIAI